MTAPARKGPRVRTHLAHRMPPPEGEYRWVYLWGWPIRAAHWVAAASLVTLVITGFYIGKPYFITSGEASSHFLMGRVRFLHFAAAALLVATGILRVYWLFAGNKFERLKALLPYHPQDFRRMWIQIKAYLLIHPERAPHYLGHNPLQQMSYTGIYAAVLVSIATGFALYGDANPNGIFHAVFTSWMGPLFGGIQRVRFVHHVLTWAFLIFVPIHVYLAMRSDMLERTGTISSIVSGGRFVDANVDYVDDDPEQA